MLNGEDQDAFIADANLERRDLSKGQKAMLIAEGFPQERKGGAGKRPLITRRNPPGYPHDESAKPARSSSTRPSWSTW